MKYQVRALALFVLLPALFVLACSGGSDDSGRLRVVATTTQIGDMARIVGGERISLTTLLKPNQDAHDFSPSPGQVKDLVNSDIVLRHGLDLDSYVDKEVSKADKVTEVTEGIDTRPGEGDEAEDPHVWFDVANAKIMVGNIRDALAETDTTNADYYKDNATKYLSELDALDREIRGLVNQVPASCRKLVTNHDVLAYYAAAYGFGLVGSVIPATTSEARASAADVADIVRKIRAEGVPAIFAEASINPDLMKQVAREANVKLVDDLYGDSLGPKDSEGATYAGMMRADTKKIVDALRGC